MPPNCWRTWLTFIAVEWINGRVWSLFQRALTLNSFSFVLFSVHPLKSTEKKSILIKGSKGQYQLSNYYCQPFHHLWLNAQLNVWFVIFLLPRRCGRCCCCYSCHFVSVRFHSIFCLGVRSTLNPKKKSSIISGFCSLLVSPRHDFLFFNDHASAGFFFSFFICLLFDKLKMIGVDERTMQYVYTRIKCAFSKLMKTQWSKEGDKLIKMINWMPWRTAGWTSKAKQNEEKVQPAGAQWIKINPETVKNNTEMKFSD